jgi:hypothetical protein
MARLTFDSNYDTLIDSLGKFGDEKKYYDFYFLHFEFKEYNDILNYLFDNNINENNQVSIFIYNLTACNIKQLLRQTRRT